MRNQSYKSIGLKGIRMFNKIGKGYTTVYPPLQPCTYRAVILNNIFYNNIKTYTARS